MKLTNPTALEPVAINPAICPLCGKANLCAMEQARISGEPQGPCWCTQLDFSAELLARVPADAKGLACVCADCARAAAA